MTCRTTLSSEEEKMDEWKEYCGVKAFLKKKFCRFQTVVVPARKMAFTIRCLHQPSATSVKMHPQMTIAAEGWKHNQLPGGHDQAECTIDVEGRLRKVPSLVEGRKHQFMDARTVSSAGGTKMMEYSASCTKT